MVCDRCRLREATTFYKMTINGDTREEHLCSECASASYIMRDDYFNIFEDFFSPSFGFDFIPQINFSPAYAGVKRKDSIIDQAKNSIRLGANKFRDEVKDNPNALKLMNLRRELNQAVEMENYERASEIKREIDSLDKGDNNV